MAKVAGVDVLLYVQDGYEEETPGGGGGNKEDEGVEVKAQTPKFTVLGGQTEATLNREAEEIDVSSKDDADGYGDMLVGKKSWNIEAEGFYIDGDTAFEKIEDLFESRSHVNVELRMPSGKKYSGKCYITEFPYEFPQDDGATYSLTLVGAGPLVRTPAA